MSGPVSDAFLLSVAEVSSALIGLFLVGVFFYVETGFRRLTLSRDLAQPYFRAATKVVLILYSMSIGLSLTLVSLDLIWSRGFYVLISLVLILAHAQSVHIRSLGRATGSAALKVDEVVGIFGVVALLTVPWILGGAAPSREDLTWAVLLAFATGSLSIVTIVLSAFDLASLEGGRSDDEVPGSE